MRRQDRQHGRHNPKTPENRSGTNPEATSCSKDCSKENPDRHVYLESVVLVDVVEKLKEQHKSEREEDTGHQKWQLRWTIFAAGLVFLYTGAAFWQGSSSQKAADAAKEAANTARDALHVSERAYIDVSIPAFVRADKVAIPYANSGHIPSGPVTVTFFVIAGNVTNTSQVDGHTKNAINAFLDCFKELRPDPVPAGNQTRWFFYVPTPGVDMEKIKAGSQQAYIRGHFLYRDGFPDTPERDYPFCYFTRSSGSDVGQWGPCDIYQEARLPQKDTSGAVCPDPN